LRYAVPESFRDARGAALSPELVEQIKLCVLLGYGFAFSLLGTGGLASLAALLIGWEARRRIKRSGRRLVGVRLAWWCIVFGGLGALVLPAALALLNAPRP
jgi:hypothetical protein